MVFCVFVLPEQGSSMNQIHVLQSQKPAAESEALGEKIEHIVETLPPQEVTLVEIMDIVGVDSLLLLTIFLSLIFLVPVSIPGVSTVFGSAILLIGITNLFSKKYGCRRRSRIGNYLRTNCVKDFNARWYGCAALKK